MSLPNRTYVIDLRVERAAEQLQTTTATVAAVANDNGCAFRVLPQYCVQAPLRRVSGAVTPPRCEAVSAIHGQVNSGPHWLSRQS